MQEVPIIIITEQHRYRLCLKSHNAEWPFTRRASPNAKGPTEPSVSAEGCKQRAKYPDYQTGHCQARKDLKTR